MSSVPTADSPSKGGLKCFALVSRCLLSRLTILLALGLEAGWADGLEIQIRMPDELAFASQYDATVTVRTAVPLADAYVKLSLPSAFQAKGPTSYRGQLSPGEFQLKLQLQAVSTFDGPIQARVIVFGDQGDVLAGRAELLDCSAHESGITVRRRNTEPASAQMLNQAASAEDRASDQADRRFIVSESLGGRVTPPQRPRQEILPNTSVNGWLDSQDNTVFSFTGRGGHRIWITATSAEFDTRLLLVDPHGTVLAENDDGVGIVDSRIPQDGVFELVRDGTYFIVVESYERGGSGDFQLRLDDFTLLNTEPEPVSPTKSVQSEKHAGSAKAAVSLSGRVVYVDSEDFISPVRYGVVRLFSQGLFTTTEIAAARTDVNGNVVLSVPEANRNDTLFIRAYTTDAGIGIATVQDPLWGLHSARRESFTLPSSSQVTFGTWNVAGEGMNGPFLVFDALVEGYLVALGVLQYTPTAAVVNYPVRNVLGGLLSDPLDIDAHYDPRTKQISLGELYSRAPDVVLHEYGHFLADQNGFNQTQGGTHTIPFYQRVNASLAWGEAWATLFSVAGQNARGKGTKRNFVSNHPQNMMDYDLENGHLPSVISELAAGDDNEGSVQFVLWDLFDSWTDALPVSGSSDRAAFGLKTIFDVARGGVALFSPDGSIQLYRVDHLETFYGALLQNLDLSSSQIAAVSDVVADQHIRWEVPPRPPAGLRFVTENDAIRLEWAPPANAGIVGYVVERRLPGQSSFAILTSTTDTFVTLTSPTVGTGFRVFALGVNVARFAAPLSSLPSAELVLDSLPATPSISLSETQLTFEVADPSAGDLTKNVRVSNVGSGVLRWEAQADRDWITVTPSSGTAPSTVLVSVNPQGLNAGPHTGKVTVSSAAASGRTLTVVVNVRDGVKKTVQISAVVSGASFTPRIAPSGWITILGQNLSTSARTWKASEIVDGRLPTELDGIRVFVEGRSAFVYYVSPTQINAQAPSDINIALGGRQIEVLVTTPDGQAIFATTIHPVAPAMFTYTVNGKRRAAAVHPDGVLVGAQGLIPGAVTRDAKPGDIIQLYATGLGLNTEPFVDAGTIPRQPAVLKDALDLRVGGLPATIVYGGLVSPGLYQINAVVPSLTDGEHIVELKVNGIESEGQVLLTVGKPS